MKSDSFRLLKKIVKEKELSYRAAACMLPIRFGDHRDFYPLATLHSAGYISATVNYKIKSDEPDPNRFIASYFFAMTRGEGKYKCNAFTANNDQGTDLRNVIFSTAKADLYFSERREKRVERMFALGLGIVLAVFSSLFALWAQAYWG